MFSIRRPTIAKIQSGCNAFNICAYIASDSSECVHNYHISNEYYT